MLKKIRWNRMKLLALNAQTERKKISHTNSGWKRTKMCKNGAKGQGRRQQAEQLQKKKKVFHQYKYKLPWRKVCSNANTVVYCKVLIWEKQRKRKGASLKYTGLQQLKLLFHIPAVQGGNWICCFNSMKSIRLNHNKSGIVFSGGNTDFYRIQFEKKNK